MTELLLYAAARAQLVKENIKPALSAGKAVIADRFVDSSAVYQGIGRGLGIDTVYKVNEFALQGILPDMTFLMDLDAEAGIARKKNQAELDRMEQESLEFHKKVVEGYRCLAEMNPDRIVKVDAALPKEVIHDIIISYVENGWQDHSISKEKSMIEFSEIIGHEDIIQHFKRSIEMGKVSQGYIINGEEGSGKRL